MVASVQDLHISPTVQRCVQRHARSAEGHLETIDRCQCECGWLDGLCVGPGTNLTMSLQCNRHQHPQQPLVP